MVQESAQPDQKIGLWSLHADKQLVTPPDPFGFPRASDGGKGMEVFLVPSRGTSYDLYCEPTEDDSPGSSRVGRVFRRVREMLSTDRGGDDPRRSEFGAMISASSWTDRVRSGAGHRLSEWLAEQRLLWHLRHPSTVTLVFPNDIDAERALSIARVTLQRDRDHHRVWMVVDGLATAVFGPLFFFVPGPNLVSWYFTAKTAGHWLAYQGAARGVDQVRWAARPSGALAAVRDALARPPAERHHRLGELATELQLDHPAVFVQRTAR